MLTRPVFPSFQVGFIGLQLIGSGDGLNIIRFLRHKQICRKKADRHSSHQLIPYICLHPRWFLTITFFLKSSTSCANFTWTLFSSCHSSESSSSILLILRDRMTNASSPPSVFWCCKLSYKVTGKNQILFGFSFVFVEMSYIFVGLLNIDNLLWHFNV